MNWQERFNQYLTPKRQRVFLIALLIIYAFFLTYKINGPFIGTSEAFSGMYGIAAWNWLIHGPIELKFTMMTPYGTQVILPEITKTFFLNHPSFFIAPTAFLYWLFGVGEWQTRLSPIIFSLISLAVFWTLIERVFKTPWLTAISSLFYIFFPMGIFYGRMLTHDPIALFFILALFLAVILYEQKKSGGYLATIGIVTFLGGLTDWQFFFAAAAVWLYIAFKRDYPKRRLALVLIPSILAASLGVTLLQIWGIAHTNPFAFLRSIFFDRTGGFSFSVIPLFLLMRLNFDLIGFSEVGLLLALVGAIFYLKENKKNAPKLLFAALLIAPGFLTYLIFYSHASGHQFMGLYFIPPIALLAAWGIGRVRNSWHAGALLLVFLASSAWYASNLFAYQSFDPKDFEMLKRARASVPPEESICMGENSVNTNIKFYLFPHQLNDAPCPTDSYFVLRRPESYAQKDPSFSLLQTFFTNTFRQNVHRISFLAAAGMEMGKSLPWLKHKIERVFANHDPHADYALYAVQIQSLIEKHNLRPADCSPNFCLYISEKQ